MKVLLMGVGMQGKAALFDLAQNGIFDEIVAADVDLDGLLDFHKQRSLGQRVRCERLDMADAASMGRLFSESPDVVIDLLPPAYLNTVAQAAVSHGASLVNTCFIEPALLEIEQLAVEKAVTILPEFGVDPGIDLLLLGDALGKLDEVEEIRSYGAGIPEPEFSRDNPLRYKATWTLEGVLRAYLREATLVREGTLQSIPANELFAAKNVHSVNVADIGELEAYPNGDATRLAHQAGLDPTQLDHLGCYTMRWPGHSAIWRQLVALGLLDDSDVVVDGASISKKKFLAAAFEPLVRLGADERDVVIIRVDVVGLKDNKRVRIVNQLIDYRDLRSGFTAMSRTVGFTASIGAELLATGAVDKQGIAHAIRDIPFDTMKRLLAKRGIVLTSEVCVEPTVE